MINANLVPLSLMVLGIGLAVSSFMSLIKAYRLRQSLRGKIFIVSSSQSRKTTASYGMRKFFVRPIMRAETVFPVLLMGIFGIALANLAPVNQWGPGARVTVIIAALYVGYRIPFMRRDKLLAQYRAEIERDLPAMIDLLVVMLEAGSTFDDAVSRLVNDPRFPDSAIKQELARLMAELAITPHRHVAFQKFGASTALNDLRLFSSVLVQSENFGTPISKGLQSLAFEIRERLSHEVEAKGSALGPKLAIPMTVFFLPLIFIVVLTPSIIRSLRLS
jgi:tight adherence protein C